jgi:hypothetical protein
MEIDLGREPSKENFGKLTYLNQTNLKKISEAVSIKTCSTRDEQFSDKQPASDYSPVQSKN